MKFTKETTYGDKYRPAMNVKTKEEASRYFEACVEHLMKYGKKTRKEAEKIERANIGYWSGYYDKETMKRVQDLYEAAHPIFGRA